MCPVNIIDIQISRRAGIIVMCTSGDFYTPIFLYMPLTQPLPRNPPLSRNYPNSLSFNLPGQRLGDAAKAAGLNIPYGCKEGVCGTCEVTTHMHLHMYACKHAYIRIYIHTNITTIGGICMQKSNAPCQHALQNNAIHHAHITQMHASRYSHMRQKK